MFDTSSESYYAELLESAKNSNLEKLEFFLQNAVLMLNVCKINVQKMISYTF